MEINNGQLVFIVGVGRSGTTLLQSMLNAHPDVCFPPETHFFRLYIQNGKYKKLTRHTSAIGLAEYFKSDNYLKRLEIDFDYLFKRFRIYDRIPSGEQFYQMLLSEYANMRNKKVVGDKDPKNIEFVSDLHHFFPNASIIHIIRDPRDVILSRMKADWSKGRNILHHIFVYKFQIQIGRQVGNQLFKERYFEVIYEQLLDDPAEILRKISNFLRIPYSANMLDFSSSAREIVDDSELQWKKEAIGPLLKNNWGKWRNDLSKRQTLLIERSCQEVFFDNPYNVSDIRQTEGMFNRAFTKIVSTFLFIFCALYRKVRCR
jgi:hypothetical protein